MPGWYSSRCPTISTRSRPAAARATRSASVDRLRERLLDEAVLAGLEHRDRKRRVRRHGRREHDRVELGILEQILEVGR